MCIRDRPRTTVLSLLAKRSAAASPISRGGSVEVPTKTAPPQPASTTTRPLPAIGGNAHTQELGVDIHNNTANHHTTPSPSDDDPLSHNKKQQLIPSNMVIVEPTGSSSTEQDVVNDNKDSTCLLYTSPSPRDS
eukprot:TRINITY_DN64395_c0_g1_i1.p1 TRINITY_DN64395_c0_g1~~TRINITY_DN64395_c0_g1_i1.p1  ORF type:complete len:149 (-),score=29.39 TRINITY_DN64395_c0_g1_i1:25-426(-)